MPRKAPTQPRHAIFPSKPYQHTTTAMKMTTAAKEPRMVRGNQLKPSAREEALRGYVYRQTHENFRRNPFAVNVVGKLPPIPDEQWLAISDFYVTANGDLHKRRVFCITHHSEIPEWKAIMDTYKESPLLIK